MMLIRSLLLFTHIGAMATLFAVLGLELVSLESLRRIATRSDASPALRILRALPRAHMISLVLILLSGIVLAARVGVHGFPWVRVSFATLVLIGIAGGVLIRSRRRALVSGETVEAIRSHASDFLLRASVRTRISLGLAAMYLMIAKSNLLVSLVVLGTALVAGLVFSASRPAPVETKEPTW